MTDFMIIRSRRRTLSLEITPDGKVLVRAPKRLPQKAIDDFVMRHTAWIAEKTAATSSRSVFEEEHFGTAEKREALRAQAKQVLPALLDHYAALMHVSYRGMRITDAKKRFGSCNAEDHICFSLRLMAYPTPAWDYVVVHELAHVRHKNHGKEFYRLIESILPDYREREKLLRF